MILRQPSEKEKEQLVSYLWYDWFTNPDDSDFQEVKDHVANAAIAVFEGYITDGPGYAGNVMVIVWSGDPSFIEAFIWNQGEIEKLPIDIRQ